MPQPHDIHEDWIEFFNRDSTPPQQERYYAYMLRRSKEEGMKDSDKM